MVQERTFRADLYYRLNVFPITVPPLRERPEDIPLLIEHFVQKFAKRQGKSIVRIPDQAMEALIGYRWPGNIRELQNLIERAVILSDNGILSNPMPAPQNRERNPLAIPPVHGTLRDSERAIILRTLEAARWMIGGSAGAAALLGLKRTTLIGKMKKLGIARPAVQSYIDVPNRNRVTQDWLRQAAE